MTANRADYPVRRHFIYIVTQNVNIYVTVNFENFTKISQIYIEKQYVIQYNLI